MSFTDKCRHCEHYHEGGTCCFCAKEHRFTKKTMDEHRKEMKELAD